MHRGVFVLQELLIRCVLGLCIQMAVALMFTPVRFISL